MAELMRCPTCQVVVPVEAHFCPGCGRPRTVVERRLRAEAKRLDVPYADLLAFEQTEERRRVAAEQRVAMVEARLGTLERQVAAAPAGGSMRLPRPVARRQPVRRPRAAALAASAPPALRTVPPAPVSPASVVLPPVPAEPLAPPVPALAAREPAVLEPPASGWPEPPPRPAGMGAEPVVPLVPPVVVAPLPARVEDAAFPEPPLPEVVVAPRAPRDLEDLVSGRGLAWLGGLAILAGAIFFLSVAFSRGWIGPGARVVAGVAVAAVMLAAGARLFGRREATIGHVLVAVALGIMNLSMVAATRLYDLVPLPLALAGILLASGAAAAIAVRANLQIVAGYGLVAALAAPPLMGADPALSTVGYVGVVLAATTAIALLRTWTWLPPAAYVLTVPQFGLWLVDGEPRLAVALPAIAVYWLLHALAAGGEEFRIPRNRLSPGSATLLVANGAFAVWAGFTILAGPDEGSRGAFLALLALAHGALSWWFLVRRDDEHPFGMLAAGTGLALLTMAVPVQFGGNIVPLAWSAEAVALAWVAARRQHRYAGAMATAAMTLAVGHLLGVEYRPGFLVDRLDDAGSSARPFLNATFLTLAFVVAALLAAGWVSRLRTARLVVGAVAIVLVAWSASFETSGPWLVIAWAALVAVVVVAAARLRLPQLEWFAPGVLAPALLHLAIFEYRFTPTTLDGPVDSRLLHTAGLAAAATLAALAIVVWQASVCRVRRVALAAGIALVAWSTPFEVIGVWLSLAWTVQAVLLTVATTRWRQVVTGVGVLATITFAAANLVLLIYQWPIFGEKANDPPPFLDQRGLALLIVVAGLAAIGGLSGARWVRLLALAGSGLLLMDAGFWELQGFWEIWWLAGLAVVAREVAAHPAVLPVPDDPTAWLKIRGTRIRLLAAATPAIAGFFAFALSLNRPLDDTGSLWRDTPGWFTDEQTLGAAGFLLAAAVLAWRGAGSQLRPVAAAAGLVIAALLVPAETSPAVSVALWAALAAGAALASARIDGLQRVGRGGFGLIGASALVAALGVVAPPTRLWVRAGVVIDHPPLLSGATLALAAVALGALGGWRWLQVPARWVRVLPLVAAVLLIDLLSIAVVDLFAGQVGGEVPLQSLQRRSLVGLSVLWALIGGGAFIAGVVRDQRAVRIAALAFLALTTIKVFVFDMANLDATYRVPSFIALGLLLLLSSWFYQRLRGRTPSASSTDNA